MPEAPGAIKMAGVAQKMVNILAFNCPPNYHCGGPAHAAQVSLDSILHLMGVGVALLQRSPSHNNTEEYQKDVLENAVCGPSILSTFVQHKSQILAGAMHAIISNIRSTSFRECPEVTEKALLMLLQWYFERSGTSQEEFVKKLTAGNHDELLQLESEGT